MLDAYKRRLRQSGNSMSEAIRQQNNMIMDATFTNSVDYKSVIIDNQTVDARFIASKTTTPVSGVIVEYLLQFRPKIKFALGSYVSIPNDDGIFEDWLLVGLSDDVLFPKYNILKCNLELKWLNDKKIVIQKVVLRSKGSSIGVANNSYMTVTDGQYIIYLPTNQDVQSIGYDTRFLISSNPLKAKSYKVTDFGDELSKGVTKLTLSKDEVGVYDNTELMIADYYKVFPKTNTENGVYSYQLVGVDSITINSGATYQVLASLNDETQELATNVTYSVTDINGEVSGLVTYSVINGEITIRTNSTKGTIVLTAIINGVTINKTIKIKGLL